MQLDLFNENEESHQEQPEQEESTETTEVNEEQPEEREEHPEQIETIQDAFNLSTEHYRVELSLSDFLANYRRIQESRESIITYLNTKTVKVLMNIEYKTGSYPRNGDKKADHVKTIYSNLLGMFLLDRSVTVTTFTADGYKENKAKVIEGTTEEFLNEWYAKQKAEEAEKEKALSNPETLSEYGTFISANGEDALSADQKAHRDQLRADQTMKRQEQEQERSAQVAQVDIKTAEFELHPTKHSKTGADIYTVVMTERVDRDTFKELRTKSKQFGGYYSRYVDKRATPPVLAGFNFKTEDDARSFMGLKDNDQSTMERKQEHAAEVKLSASERLKVMAQGIKEKAQESLNQDRLVNTHRRARQAAHAEQKATSEIKFADKLSKIADGLENGSIKYLGQLRNGKQLEQLEYLLRRGYNIRLDKLNLSYAETMKEEPKPLEDVEYVVYPYPTYDKETLKDILLKHSDTPGMKQGVARILKSIPMHNNDSHLIVFEGAHLLNLLKTTAQKITDRWDRDRILDPIKSYERMQKMGLTDLPILRTALRELIATTQGAGISQAEKDALEMKNLEREFIGRKIPGFFPTPKELAGDVIDKVRVYPGDIIAEPNAGLGHLAQIIKERYPENELKVLEIQNSLVEVLEKKGFNVIGRDFLECTEQFDVIIMNPPFEKHQDIDHVRHAYSLLKPGGRLVAIMAGNKKNSSQSVVNEFMEFVDEHGYHQDNEPGAFKSAFRSTGVSTVTVYLEKPDTSEGV